MPAQTQEVLFEEEQSFGYRWAFALLAVVLLLVVAPLGFVLCDAAAKAHPDRPSGMFGFGIGITSAIGALTLLAFLKLSVRLDDHGLHVRCFPLVKRDISLEEIARWEARTYNPLLEYGGWGIRYGWKGTAYNMGGNRGLQLEFTDGKRLLIGSQRSEEFAAALSQAKHVG
jgi:hypothetical protein